MRQGASIYSNEQRLEFPLSVAVINNSADIVRYLLLTSLSGPREYNEEELAEALQYAQQYGYTEISELLENYPHNLQLVR